MVSFLWLLVSVLLVIGLAYWFTRYVVGRGSFGSSQGGCRMQIMSQLALGREQKLLLVQVGEHWFLLGVTGTNISTLAEFTEEEATAWCEVPEVKSGSAGFRETLQKMLEQRGRR